MAEDRYEILVAPLPAEEGGGFIAIVPDLPGCMSDGETREEAAANVHDAISAWLSAQKAAKRPAPKPGSAREAMIKEDRELLRLIEEQRETLDAQDKLIRRLEQRMRELEAGPRGLAGSAFRSGAWAVATGKRPAPRRGPVRAASNS